jgi:dUTPase
VTVKIQWERLNREVMMPKWNEEKTYFSFFAPDTFTIREGDKLLIPTGLYVELPEEHILVIQPNPEFLRLGVTVDNVAVYRQDDLFKLTDKHQIYISMSCGQLNANQFHRNEDVIARGIIVHSGYAEFEDVTEIEEMTEERSDEIVDNVKKLFEPQKDEEELQEEHADTQ